MNPFNILVVFSVTWWLVLLMALPVGVRIHHEEGSGHASSAPSNPRLGLKVLITTIITAIITALFFFLMQNGYLDFIQLRAE